MLNITGTIKIASGERKGHLSRNLASMRPIAHLLRWHLNIDGGNDAIWARGEILRQWPDAEITLDGETSAYRLLRTQMDGLGKDSVVFLWLEDHWFLCPHVNLFVALFRAFEKSDAELLNVTHLTTSWANKHLLTVINDTHLYTTYQVDAEGQGRVWAEYPGAYLTGIPAIYRWPLINDILEFKRDIIGDTKLPNFELPPSLARTFLRARSFNEMIPKFHIFREVFPHNKHPRGVSMANAEAWLRLRDGGSAFGGHPGGPQGQCIGSKVDEKPFLW